MTESDAALRKGTIYRGGPPLQNVVTAAAAAVASGGGERPSERAIQTATYSAAAAVFSS